MQINCRSYLKNLLYTGTATAATGFAYGFAYGFGVEPAWFDITHTDCFSTQPGLCHRFFACPAKRVFDAQWAYPRGTG